MPEMKRVINFFFLLFSFNLAMQAENEAANTYLYAHKDGQDLYLDIYEPADSTTFASIDDSTRVRKPTILFVFGGGFISGERDNVFYLPWFEKLRSDGYRVVSIDYRLGLKGVKKMGIAQRDLLDKAIHMAVEDLFDSILFLRDNAGDLGVDVNNLVLAGSSAGAITVLQADYELCNRTSCAQVLPEDLHFAGIMSFSGAIYSTKGLLKDENSAPAPTLFLHGTADKLVNYDQIKWMNIGFFGSKRIVERFDKFGYPYTIVRFKDHGHEIASSMGYTVEIQKEFLMTEVLRKVRRVIDLTVSDPRIEAPEKWKKGPEELYK